MNGFQLTNEEGDMVYTNNVGELFHRSVETKEKRRLDSGTVSSFTMTLEGDVLYYIQYSDDRHPLLKKVKVADDIEVAYDYQLANETIYFQTDDRSLYSITGDEQPQEVAQNVSNFEWADGYVVFQTGDNALYKWVEATNETQEVAPDGVYFHVSETGDVFYLTSTNDLYRNDEKIAAGLGWFYSHYQGNVAYAVSNQLYLIDEAGEEMLVMDDLSGYSAVYYQNSAVYFE